jgi:hypothetical protein
MFRILVRLSIAIVLGISVFSTPVFAESVTPASSSVLCADGTAGCTPLPKPLVSDATDPVEIIGTLIRSVLLLIGSVTLLMFVWGGFLWLTSAGNEERVEKGSQTMLWAAIGVFLVFASYLILNTYLNLLTGQA